MPWFLTLNPGLGKEGKSVTYQLQDNADLDRIAQQMVHFSGPDRAVEVPIIYGNSRKPITLFVRPAAWATWGLYEMSDAERREMLAARLKNMAQLQALRQQQQRQAAGQGANPAGAQHRGTQSQGAQPGMAAPQQRQAQPGANPQVPRMTVPQGNQPGANPQNPARVSIPQQRQPAANPPQGQRPSEKKQPGSGPSALPRLT